MGDLKPCPFCGEFKVYDAQPFTTTRTDMSMKQYVVVVCPVCELESDGNYTKRKAIEDWNTRPTETQLRAELDRMTAAVIKDGYACDGVCNMCMCEYAEARAIRAKYGFDK